MTKKELSAMMKELGKKRWANVNKIERSKFGKKLAAIRWKKKKS